MSYYCNNNNKAHKDPVLGWHNGHEVKKANRMSICDEGGLGKYLKIKSELEM